MAINVLDPIIASRIAAGEVVDRPASVLRELMDNSVDAGAKNVKVYIEEGGIKNITVIDDSCGFEKEDLPKACLSHATSKIHTLDDLFSLRTLGFRGEALCSVASVSKITISSNGYSIINDNGNQGNVSPGPIQNGTSISVEGIFENIPARKQFLKRPTSEALECKKIFIEKALGAPNVSFMLFSDDKLELNLLAKNQKERALDILSLDRSFISVDSLTMEIEDEPVKLFAVSSAPSCYKRDRSQIKILVNNRIIDCYQLVQAITTSYSVSLPGGAFPFFYLFIENSPTMLDFNIHPTKRECKIRNQSTIYGLITKMVRESLLSYNRRPKKEETTIEDEDFSELIPVAKEIPVYKPKTESFTLSESPRKLDPSFFEMARKALSSKPEVKVQDRNFKYIGQVFNTFLAVEKDEKLMLIDQHAAHERILYDQIKAKPDKQLLAIGYKFDTDSGVDEFLLNNSFIYQEFGVDLVRIKPMLWEMTSVPAVSKKNEEKIVSCIQTAIGDIVEAQKGLFAVIACHSAIKAGDIVDSNTAIELLDKVFKLDSLLCPHGRSFVYEISKTDLYREVGRLI